ncbi:hypothetical protein HJC23_003015 [Cyclotella cryptica]|uniref:N-acetyltransferase domain-containing protein n=1 Tax=Cyclotella cryptica TaxID=29204 RepID=A0ABD3PUI2_9STRA|eukprot:CCRYP_011834-RA/>CCRYP_011834-RA protein AED:0.06 eAED:0.06 QI:0/-1/0/1/-1/1/1/0/468
MESAERIVKAKANNSAPAGAVANKLNDNLNDDDDAGMSTRSVRNSSPSTQVDRTDHDSPSPDLPSPPDVEVIGNMIVDTLKDGLREQDSELDDGGKESNVVVDVEVGEILSGDERINVSGTSPYTISPILTIEEGLKTKEVGKRVFGIGEYLLMPRKPKWGFYAHEGDDYVGGIFIEQVGPREGMVSYIFVDSMAQGHKLGARLLDAGIKAMDEKRLKTQFALILDGNTASWNMFAKNGYKRPGVFRSLFGYSPRSFPKRLGYSLAFIGYNTWVRDDGLKNTDIHPKRWAMLESLLFSLFIGASLSLFSLRGGTEFLLTGIAVVAGITALRMALAYPIARMYGPVRFNRPEGGTLLSAILALAFGTWWPTFGFFVPKEDIWRDRDFGRYLGLQAFVAWMSLVAVYVGMSRLYPGLFNSGLETTVDLIIIYQMIPFFPFDSMDGAKVANYSKVMYVIGFALSLTAIILF